MPNTFHIQPGTNSPVPNHLALKHFKNKFKFTENSFACRVSCLPASPYPVEGLVLLHFYARDICVKAALTLPKSCLLACVFLTVPFDH